MNQEPLYYLYRHIDLTQKIPFYIGVGKIRTKKKTYKGRYGRAFEKAPRQRNEYWLDLAKATEYRVEILLHSESEDFIYKKEIEFIALYGRAILGEGPLVNITRGGRGTTGTGMRKRGGRSIVYTYDKQGKFFKRFDTFADCARHFGATIAMISDQVRGRGANMSYKGYLFFTENHGEFFWDYERYFEVIIRPGEQNKIAVNYLDHEMNLIKSFKSMKDAADFYKIGHDAVLTYAGNGRPDSKGNYWRRDGETKEFDEFDVQGYRKHGGPPYEPVFAYKIDTGDFFGKYESIHTAAKETKCPRCNISSIIRGKDNAKTVNGLTFFSEYRGDNIGKVQYGKTKKVGKFEKGILVEQFDSAIDAGKKYNLNPKSIRGYCGNQKRSGSLTAKWRFLD